MEKPAERLTLRRSQQSVPFRFAWSKESLRADDRVKEPTIQACQFIIGLDSSIA